MMIKIVGSPSTCPRCGHNLDFYMETEKPKIPKQVFFDMCKCPHCGFKVEP